MIDDLRQIKLIVNSTNNNEPVRSDLLKLVTDVLCSNFPVCQLVPTAPCGCCHTTPSDLISQIHANNSWVFSISFCHFSQTFKKLLLWILFIIPQSITIIRTTTPLGFTGMIVQNDHQT